MFGRSQVHEELTVIKSQRETNSVSLLPAVKHPICTSNILCSYPRFRNESTGISLAHPCPSIENPNIYRGPTATEVGKKHINISTLNIFILRISRMNHRK